MSCTNVTNPTTFNTTRSSSASTLFMPKEKMSIHVGIMKPIGCKFVALQRDLTIIHFAVQDADFGPNMANTHTHLSVSVKKWI